MPFKSEEQRSFLKRTKPKLYKKWKKKYSLEIKPKGGKKIMVKQKKKKLNPWMKHLKEYKEKHPDKPYGECMALAKKTYKKK